MRIISGTFGIITNLAERGLGLLITFRVLVDHLRLRLKDFEKVESVGCVSKIYAIKAFQFFLLIEL
jgi:hypothetical protein